MMWANGTRMHTPNELRRTYQPLAPTEGRPRAPVPDLGQMPRRGRGFVGLVQLPSAENAEDKPAPAGPGLGYRFTHGAQRAAPDHPLLPVAGRRPDSVRPLGAGPAADHLDLLAQPPGVRPGKPGLAALGAGDGRYRHHDPLRRKGFR